MKSAKELWVEHKVYMAQAEARAEEESCEWAKEWLDENGELVSKALIEKGSFEGDILCREMEARMLVELLTELGYEADFLYNEEDGYEGYNFLIRFGDMNER